MYDMGYSSISMFLSVVLSFNCVIYLVIEREKNVWDHRIRTYTRYILVVHMRTFVYSTHMHVFKYRKKIFVTNRFELEFFSNIYISCE